MTATATATSPAYVKVITGGRQGVADVAQYLRGKPNEIELADATTIAPERIAALVAVLERPSSLTISGDGTRPAPGREADWLTQLLGKGEDRTGGLGVVITVGKSLSAKAAKDPAVAEAVIKALGVGAEAYAKYVAEHAVTRIKVGGEIFQVAIDPASLRGSGWTHLHSAAGDPHFHMHLILSATVKAEGDDKPRALDTRHYLAEVASMAGAEARAAMIQVLREAGIEVDPLTMELAGLNEHDHDLLAEFSTMASTVEAYEATGVTHETAGQAARRAMRGDFGHPANNEVDVEHLKQVQRMVTAWQRVPWEIDGPDGPMAIQISKPEALEHALDALMRTDEGRKAVLAFHNLRSGGAWRELMDALDAAQARGHTYTLDELAQSLQAATDAGQTITPQALAGHAHVISVSLNLDEELINDYLAKRFIKVPGRRGLVATFTAEADLDLTDKAIEAMNPAVDVEEALSWSVGLTVVGGVAGAGKTSAAMQAARETWAQEPGKIVVLSRNRKTARELGEAVEAALIEVKSTRTVLHMSLASRRWRDEIQPGDRIVVDEYALAERNDLDTLVQLAKTSPVTLLGDIHQQRAIGTPSAAVTMARVASWMGQPHLADTRRCEAWKEVHDDLRAAPTDEAALERAVQALKIRDVGSVAEAARLVAETDGTLLAVSNALVADAARERLGEIDGRSVTIQRGVKVGVGNQVVFRRIVKSHQHVIGETGEMAKIEAISGDHVTLLVGKDERREMMPIATARKALASAEAMTIDASQGLTLTRGAVILTGTEDANALYTALSRFTEQPEVYRLRNAEPNEATRALEEDEREARDVVRDVLARTDRWSVLDLTAAQAEDVAEQLRQKQRGDLAERLMSKVTMGIIRDQPTPPAEPVEVTQPARQQTKPVQTTQRPTPPAPPPSRREAERPRPRPKENPYTSPEVLAQLAKSEKPEVREAVAKNPHTPPDVLAELAQDEVRDVRWAARNNPNAPPEIGLSRDVPMPSPGLGSTGMGLDIGF